MMEKATLEVFKAICEITGRATMGLLMSTALGAAAACFIEKKFSKGFLHDADQLTKQVEAQVKKTVLGE